MDKRHRSVKTVNHSKTGSIKMLYECKTESFLSAELFCNLRILVLQKEMPTLKNSEDVKKSCMRGSNRIGPISETKMTKDQSCTCCVIYLLQCKTQAKRKSINMCVWQTKGSKLTGTWDNRNVAQQGEDLRAEQGPIPDLQEFVEERFWTRKPLLVEEIYDSM